MKIRSITCFYNPISKDSVKILQRFSEIIREAKEVFQAVGCEVQTTRLATAPFTEFFPKNKPELGLELTRQYDQQVKELGFDYVSLGPVPLTEPDACQLIPTMLSNAENTFLSAFIADRKHGISLPAIQAAAQTIHQIAKSCPDGFFNLRFAALANVPPFTPFFPAAYAAGDEPAFAFAMQAADVVLVAFQSAKSLKQAREALLSALHRGVEKIEPIAKSLAKKYAVEFKGFDFSPAPFPEEWCSIGKALEALGLPKLGFSGSLAGAAFLADILQQGKWKKTGFNGIMLPVLEDDFLANRSAEGALGVYDLLLYSAVCGTGLDTVPLPGDITPQEIEPLLLDIAALALRLDKPLTARLMPIPGKKVGDKTDFHFDYFANGRVLDYRTSALRGLLVSNEIFKLSSRVII